MYQIGSLMIYGIHGVCRVVRQETKVLDRKAVTYLVLEPVGQEGLRIVFSGGVASNSMLREVIKPLKPIFSEPQYSTDNAMGVAVLGMRYQE